MFHQPTSPYNRKDNKPYSNEKLCIPEEITEKQILRDSHEFDLEAYQRCQERLEIVRGYFYWHKVKEEVYNYKKTVRLLNNIILQIQSDQKV